jgi:hypothetical protein
LNGRLEENKSSKKSIGFTRGMQEKQLGKKEQNVL